MALNVTVFDIDDHLEMLREDKRRITSSGQAQQHWAQRKIRSLDRVIETLTKVRQHVQMTGMNGKSIVEEALAAVPELKNLKPLVLYFADEEGRSIAAKQLEEAFRDQRLVRTVQL